MNPANHDLRAWMKEVDSIGQLHRIQGVPWDKDMGGLLEMILERSKHPPALLFEKSVEKDIDLEAFPVPRWRELDGGRYIGTDDLVITQDPEEGWVNAGTYRVMLQAQDALALYISPGKHGGLHRQKYFDMGKPCPVVMSFGHHPLLFISGCTDV